MSSNRGFQHNNLYKIMSMKDKNVIEMGSLEPPSPTKSAKSSGSVPSTSSAIASVLSSIASVFKSSESKSPTKSTKSPPLSYAPTPTMEPQPSSSISTVTTTDESSITLPLIVNKWKKESHQKFKAVQINANEFRISPLSKSTEDPPHVWDFQTASGLLFLNAWTTLPNQVFNAVEIYPKSKICFIKAVKDGRCLKNMGVGRQIALVPEDRTDAYLHWKLEPTF